ncbi:hypothetical protein SUGI_0946540 [Cryptomeria japonica]|nr:hypothetical protein SUGI_0946540 [Cryptomeria japonica]
MIEGSREHRVQKTLRGKTKDTPEKLKIKFRFIPRNVMLLSAVLALGDKNLQLCSSIYYGDTNPRGADYGKERQQYPTDPYQDHQSIQISMLEVVLRSVKGFRFHAGYTQ